MDLPTIAPYSAFFSINGNLVFQYENYESVDLSLFSYPHLKGEETLITLKVYPEAS
jgi:hypothetical protein